MKQRCRSGHYGRSLPRRGATLVLLAFLLPVAVLLSAFAINYAYMELCRTEVIITTDASTRAAGRELALTGSVEAAKVAARDAAGRNEIAGSPHVLADGDFVFGRSERTGVNTRYTFAENAINPNAVQVNVRRTNASGGGPIALLMPNILGIDDFQTSQSAQATQVEIDVAIVIDRSGSMAYSATEVANGMVPPAAAPPGWVFGNAAPPNSRWRDTISAMNVFVSELNSSSTTERVSLTTYNSTSSVDVAFTSNYTTVMSTLDTYTQNFGGGATNIADGIDSGVSTFNGGTARPWASKVLVLLTDGIQTVPGNPLAAANNAADQGIMIYSVTFSDEANQAAMQSVASATNGKHFHASTGTDLVVVFREIAQSLPTLLTK